MIQEPVHMNHPTWRLAALLTLALGLLGGCNEAKNKLVLPPSPNVGVAAPVQRAVTPYLEHTGTMTAFASVNLVARVNGYLKSINYIDGATAKTGELLFEIEPAPYQAQLKQAQAALAGAKAGLVQTQAEFERQNTLAQEEVNTQANLDKARANRDSDKANVDAADANLQTAQINLSYTRVEAPFDGVVTRHLASVGELVGTAGNTNLASIVQLDPIYVTFNISDQNVLRFRKNEGGRLTLAELQQIPIEAGFMDEEGFPHRGKIDYVSPDIDPQTATILVRGVFENKNHALLPGLYVRLRVPIGPPKADALLVPNRLLQQNQEGRYLLVVGANDEVEQRDVQLGEHDGQLRVVTAGLKPDDKVIITGLDRAIPGRKVTTRSISIASAPDGTNTSK
ncbi:efflux RND transporter periplasmic adaptor subunit [Bradyrhizobium barranii subsp. barranii]|uniref:Efflux RND transporter periplasmic adaptor subunit n=2 Tax=Bradyrhizobium barranii subsp. barranii TaxID=2823807 RepID=A0A9X9XX50_9BRAD|nr:efflux RND transporter periplasmic adaptor subunit [Bradyrhizobium barranii]UEM12244.1 efflux RND transporter periplasmic adaptor subunit [Bradyrhizobium barranii subsp. barranii]